MNFLFISEDRIKLLKSRILFQVGIRRPREMEKITQVSNCKKFHERLVGVGDEVPHPLVTQYPRQKKWVNHNELLERA